MSYSMMMRSVCKLELDMQDPETARNIAKALELDNAGYIKTRVEGNFIFAEAEADDIMALRNTVDDFLACLSVAQKSIF